MKTVRRFGCLAFLGVSVVASACSEGSAHHWTYAGEAGPEHWGRLSPEFAACANGRSQSPIDIVSPRDVELAPLEIHYDGKTTELTNNGHTIQVNVEPGNWLRADGKRWDLAQFHFHSPSEHRVQGESFPLEAHFVHRDQAGALAVVALLFRNGAADAGLASIWSRLPAQSGKSESLALSVRDLAPAPDQLPYYAYEGSLTTPPCSEGVRWHVLQTAKSVSPEQVAEFARVIGNNARGPQPLNGRPILH